MDYVLLGFLFIALFIINIICFPFALMIWIFRWARHRFNKTHGQ